ncbi:hypothetical protein GCM10009550_76680 [Actinocorallia libanotica]|uniref:Uncharacterized protein n=1 Tax=Actinocorallia libanotica TaxID=46162 RepID=A0ABP4CK87_9ACTN
MTPYTPPPTTSLSAGEGGVPARSRWVRPVLVVLGTVAVLALLFGPPLPNVAPAAM